MAQMPASFVPDSFVPDAEGQPEMNFAVVNGQRIDLDESATQRFLRNFGEMVNPVSMVKGLTQAVAHPVETASNIAAASVDQARQARDLAKEGRYFEAAGHGVATLPIIGPAAAAAGEQIAAGDIAGGLGKAAGLLVPTAIPAAVRGSGRVAAALPTRIATAAETSAAARVAEVMAPKVGANKVRFGAMATKVAPAVAADLAESGAPWTREGLHAQIGAKLADAEQALDAASDARLNARSFSTKPLIDSLLEKRRALTSTAVEGSQFPRTGSAAEPLGADVVPAPNAARVAVIDRALGELRELGPATRYDAIRTMRQAYDEPAKAVYTSAVTPDFLKAQGDKLGAADVTGTLREALAKVDPQTAAANAQYSLYRTADDVLNATAEVERTRPRVGRQIMTRLTSTLAGEHAAGVPGAVTGFVFAPAIDAALQSGITTQLKTAALLKNLAVAIRRGDIGYVDTFAKQLKRIGVQAATVVGGATSPSGSQTQTTAPAR